MRGGIYTYRVIEIRSARALFVVNPIVQNQYTLRRGGEGRGEVKSTLQAIGSKAKCSVRPKFEKIQKILISSNQYSIIFKI